MKKQWAAAIGAFAMAASMAVQAQDRGNLLQQIGRAITGAPQVSRDRAKSPYLDPQGTYWDLDQDELAGAQHIRAGLASTASAGYHTCDARLIASTRSSYRLSKTEREQCLYGEWLIDTKRNGPNGITAQEPEAIERKYGATFDARAQRFRSIQRFAVRPNIVDQPSYDRRRGILDIYVPIPWITGFQVEGIAGEGFAPTSARSERSVWTPQHAGHFHLPIRMSESEAAGLFKQGRDARDDLVVFTVKRVWLENGGPRAEVDVERVQVGYRNEVIGVDLTKQKNGES
ncbi:hypothetical protein QSH46_003385 [Xanthomonas arboricola pv. juglandis]|uniref:hypothetical protein n=1 Tax=Xanthomonas arboricola TaxID=56448 RepID=UPI0002EC3F73|nr:hypothetical protein [Xanthomonas arboricola]MDN0219079.1 hypothetical protein [Xanthomonas arboricola pv. juglandis]MDN0223623.1 hypothetical protein [Xanthomonas arboricola pv. juglandis]MDN0228077.1 hypothetical protein [Xanthomonas arboricola pv. juglandis]MDN0232044.1 hypothetical protein [Xanthomonas arboricola pv. juglandis]MDN0236606.1 hypothetical protein [Xanthomonas arboricola pv. juglandis]